MRQTSPVQVGVIVFCGLVVMIFLMKCRRDAEFEHRLQQPSPQPQQAVQPKDSPPQEPQEPPQSPPRAAPKPQQSLPPQPPEPPPPTEPEPSPVPHTLTVTEIRSVTELLEEYKVRNGAYPTTAQGLEVLGASRKDVWGHDFIYQFPSTRGREFFDFFSAGPDGKPDTPDDDWGETADPGE